MTKTRANRTFTTFEVIQAAASDDIEPSLFMDPNWAERASAGLSDLAKRIQETKPTPQEAAERLLRFSKLLQKGYVTMKVS